MPAWGSVVFASPATFKVMAVQSLHSYIMTWVIFVGCLVVFYFFSSLFCPWYARFTRGSGTLELLFSAVPVMILWVIFMPSAAALYFFDATGVSEVTVKVVGRQWYWEYEIYLENSKSWACSPSISGSGMVDVRGLSCQFESHLIPANGIRLGEVDQPLVIPFGVPIKFAITSGDVNHAWFVPAFGVKSDAIPGRINAVTVTVDLPGKYYGACAELCGEYHGFMPVIVEVVSPEDFSLWVQFNAS